MSDFEQLNYIFSSNFLINESNWRDKENIYSRPRRIEDMFCNRTALYENKYKNSNLWGPQNMLLH